VNVGTIKSRIFRDLKEEPVGNSRVTAAVILAALNDAYEEIAHEARCFTREAEITSVQDQAVYTLPADMFAIRGARFHTGTGTLSRITQAGLEVMFPTYRTAASSTPKYLYLDDVRHLGLYPAPDTAGRTLYLDGYILPYAHGESVPERGVELFTADEDVPAFPAQFHLLLVHGVVIRLATEFLNDTDDAAARVAAATASYTALLEEFTAYTGAAHGRV
jgi:hypothetical protein